MTTETKKRDVALVVDDSPETLRLLTDALDGAGMTVMVAMDGAAAMRIVDQITPDPPRPTWTVERRNFSITSPNSCSTLMSPAVLSSFAGAARQCARQAAAPGPPVAT